MLKIETNIYNVVSLSPTTRNQCAEQSKAGTAVTAKAAAQCRRGESMICSTWKQTWYRSSLGRLLPKRSFAECPWITGGIRVFSGNMLQYSGTNWISQEFTAFPLPHVCSVRPRFAAQSLTLLCEVMPSESNQI